MDKKPVYVLFPGNVRSANDGQKHFIGAPQLAQLYGVNYRECMVVYEEHLHEYRAKPHHIHLHPRYDGQYLRRDSAPTSTTADKA